MALKMASLIVLMLVASAASASPPDPSCPATMPGDREYGNAYLKTVLWTDGTIIFEPNGPGWMLGDGSLQIKFPWIRHVRGALSIRGRRLDASAPELRADIDYDFNRSKK